MMFHTFAVSLIIQYSDVNALVVISMPHASYVGKNHIN